MKSTKSTKPSQPRCETGVKGLDEVLLGGLPKNRLYVIEGEPGSGKTTLALQFLLEGSKQNEKCLYITFSETKEELSAVAESHGWDLSKLHIVDLSTVERQLAPESHTSLFHPSEVELTAITENLLKKIEEVGPSRLVFDSVSEMRLLAESPLRYRKQVLALKQNLSSRKITVIFLDDLTAASQDLQVQSIAHGVLRLSRLHHQFGGERRQIRVLKLRGLSFVSGYHDCQINYGGLEVYPRLISAQKEKKMVHTQLQSGVRELDSLVGGGLDFGTATLLIGPAGTGKSSLSMLFTLAAVAKGMRAAFFCFDETIANLQKRSEAIGMPVNEARESGNLRLQKVDPAELAPGAFTGLIRNLVESEGINVIVIDSLNGYIQAMPQEQFLTLQLHELLAYLNNQGVATILTLAQQGMIGSMSSPVDLTYLADTVVLSRFFEANGAIKKALSIIKKRTGAHENTIREYTIDQGGIRVGPVLNEFQGILTGTPVFHGKPSNILKDAES